MRFEILESYFARVGYIRSFKSFLVSVHFYRSANSLHCDYVQACYLEIRMRTLSFI